VIKARHTLRQRQKMGRLLTNLRECCHLQSGDATPVSTNCSPTKDIVARAKAMMKLGNLWATRGASMRAMLADEIETDNDSVVCVRSTHFRQHKKVEKLLGEDADRSSGQSVDLAQPANGSSWPTVKWLDGRCCCSDVPL
jgi:hypothetical protein